jgi:hypothetical protein
MPTLNPRALASGVGYLCPPPDGDVADLSQPIPAGSHGPRSTPHNSQDARRG